VNKRIRKKWAKKKVAIADLMKRIFFQQPITQKELKILKRIMDK